MFQSPRPRPGKLDVPTSDASGSQEYARASVTSLRAYRRHLPTLLIMLGLVMAVLSSRDRGSHQHDGHFDFTGHEALFEVDHAEIVAAADAHLRASDGLHWPLGGELDPETSMQSVTTRVHRDVLKALAAEHSPEEIEAFSEAGAPLVSWSVAYFRPFNYAQEKEVVHVVVDRQGRVVAADHQIRAGTGHTRGVHAEGWAEGARQQAALALQIDVQRLEPMSRTEVAGTALASSDALWRIQGLELGEYSVLVGAFEYPWVVGFRTQTVRLHEHDEHTKTNWGVAAWVAAALSVLMALFFGVWATREDTAPTPDGLLPVGLAVGVVILVGEVIMLASASHTNVPALSLFAVVGLGLGAAAFFFTRAVRKGGLTPPSNGVGIALVVFVIAAFVASCLMCGGGFARGCCERCGMLRCSVAPLVITALALAHKRPRFRTDALILSVAMLVPHCICDNFANHGWIAWIGASPMCFFLFYSAALLALIGQCGVFARTTLAVGMVALLVTVGLAVSHHMFHFPW